MPRLEAPSISITSRSVPAALSRQTSHAPHASDPFRSGQRRARARSRAVVVFPLPRPPAPPRAPPPPPPPPPPLPGGGGERGGGAPRGRRLAAPARPGEEVGV